MGDDLGTLFHLLWEDLAWLHQLFADYEALFADNNARLEIMNRTAPVFFSAVQQALADSILLRISRMTDPAKSPKKGGYVENVTIQGLKLPVDHPLQDALKDTIEEARKLCESARDWRDRRIAHADLKLAVGDSAPLSHASRDTIRASLAGLSRVLDLIEVDLMDTTTIWDPIAPLGDPEDMLRYLRGGQARKTEQLAAYASGSLQWEDLDFNRPL
jgi:hypothetical protein